MAYFIPSSIQKRLLRYALSRLELLDTDALDLERLEIGWGRKSTVDLQDVSLRKEKLTSLLALPEQFCVEQATVGKLRITIPADLHTSSIIVEISNVQTRIRLHEDSDTSQSGQSKGRGKQPSQSKPFRRKASGRHDKAKGVDVLPDTEELAKSFLERESTEEKARLEAAITSQSVDLRSSVASSEAGSDESTPGIGVGFGLPAFIASFLKGIGDRLQVEVKDIAIKLDMLLDAPTEDTLRSFGATPSTICLLIDHFTAKEGDKTISLDSSQPRHLPDSPTVVKRRFALKGLQGYLITDAAIFNQVSQIFEQTTTSSSSPILNKTHSPQDADDHVRQSSVDATSSERASTRHDPQGMEMDSVFDHEQTSLPEFGANPGLSDKFRGSLADRPLSPWGDRSDDDMGASSQDLNASRHDDESERFGQRPPSLRDSLTRFREERSRLHSIGDSSPRTRRDLYSPPRMARIMSPSASDRLSHSRDLRGSHSLGPISQVDSPASSPEATAEATSRTVSPSETPMEDDLAQSQYFSHEEAQSIYMSAIHGSSVSPSVSRHMPGHWQEEDDIVAEPSKGHLKDCLGSKMDLNERPLNLDGAASSITEPHKTSGTLPPASAEQSFCGPRAIRRKLLDIHEVLVAWSEESGERSSVGQLPLEVGFKDSVRTARGASLPGSFSRYAESTASLIAHEARSPNTAPKEHDQRSTHPKRSVEVTIGDTSFHTDIASTKLLLQVYRKLAYALGSREPSNSRRSTKTADSHRTFEIRLSIKSLLLGFVEALKTDAYGAGDQHTDQSTHQIDALFHLYLSDITLDVPDLNALDYAKVEVGKASIGLANKQLVHFSQEKALRTSINDLREVRNKDFSIDFTKRGTQGSDVHIWIQPLHAHLDMHKIDETLESIGGLSGLLEIGSSVMSDSTVVTPRAKQPMARTVRFEASTRLNDDDTTESDLKINFRLGGAQVSVQGEICTVNLQCSRVTAVSRPGGTRVNVGEIRVTGPLRQGSYERAPSVVSIHDTALSYLNVPEERDLSRLIRLLTPSNNPFEDEDDFLVDTLMSQRKRGSVLRASIGRIELDCDDLKDLKLLQDLAQEMSKLSAVTRYLPEETRPGLLTIASFDKIAARVNTGSQLGELAFAFSNAEVAHVSAPALIAAAVGELLLQWGQDQTLISQIAPNTTTEYQPMFMIRMIEDELEPNIKMKLFNTCVDYSVPLSLAIADMTAAEDVGSSAATLRETTIAGHGDRTAPSKPLAARDDDVKALRVDVVTRGCAIGLTPRTIESKAMLVLDDASFVIALPDARGQQTKIDLRKAELLLIDDLHKIRPIASTHTRSASATGTGHCARHLCSQGFVNVCSLSGASIDVSVRKDGDRPGSSSITQVDISNRLFLLETCADSTKTLIDTLNGLQAPAAPSAGVKYRTEVAPVEDLMASFIGDAFAVPMEQEERHLEENSFDAEDYDGYDEDEGLTDTDLDAFDDSSTIGDDLRSDPGDDELEESIYGDLGLSELADIEAPGLLNSLRPTGAISATPAQMHESILGTLSLAQLPPQIHGKAKRFDSRRNRYLPVSKADTAKCPVQVHVKDMHVIWNMYDGYDWKHTREVINLAVQDVEARAEAKRRSRRALVEKDNDDESVIGDCLFNSIYIGVPVSNDGKDLSRQINHDIDDLVSETASRTASNAPSHTTTSTSGPSSSHKHRSSGRRLKLDRSKKHKIAIELRGVSADYYAFSPGGETQSSTDVQIKDFEIFDHVPTSTWKKFLTYLHDAGPREDKKPMVHVEICDVRPVADLTATELVVRATLLPLRLHVDQDALDFITRFFAFKDSDKPDSDESPEMPFLQRVEIPSIPVKMDYKPHRVDFAGLRSGRTKEFMNFIILDGSDFILKHVCLYGVSGFDKLHEMLEDIWMADVKSPQQLPGVLSGLNGVRTLVNMGTGMRDLVQIPIREYKKDGRIVRSISKGALAFGRTTGGELTRFGAKLAVGAQRALQGAEGAFLGPSSSRDDQGWEEGNLDPEEKRAFSHYANQPIGILQGLKGAARSLERDLLITRDVVIAISGEIRDTGSVEGAARAVVRHAPTLILRPMIGATKAVSQTMMGATNTVDPANRRRLEDKYKRY